MPYSLPSDTRYILYEETDLAQLKQKPCHFKCGIYLICTHGQALISTGVQQYIFEEQTELIFLTGSLIQVVQSSYDFKARILMFPQEVFLTYIIHSGFISGYQNRYGDNLKPPTNVYHRMTA